MTNIRPREGRIVTAKVGETLELIQWKRTADGWKTITVRGELLRFDKRAWTLQITPHHKKRFNRSEWLETRP